MKLYPKIIPSIARDTVATLMADGDIEVETMRVADAEMDMAAILKEYLAAEERVNQATREAAQGAADAGEGPPPLGDGALATDRDDVAFDAAAAELEALEDSEVGEAEPIGPQEPEPSGAEPVSESAGRTGAT